MPSTNLETLICSRVDMELVMRLHVQLANEDCVKPGWLHRWRAGPSLL